MPAANKLIDDALSLPIEERVQIIDTLLQSLNKPNADIDRIWTETAKKRLLEIRSGEVQPIPGKEVFDRIRERFNK